MREWEICAGNTWVGAFEQSENGIGYHPGRAEMVWEEEEYPSQARMGRASKQSKNGVGKDVGGEDDEVD
jgi:hypothetical protein